MLLRVNTLDPVNRRHPLLARRLAWWFPAQWLAGGPRVYDLIGATPATLGGGYSWPSSAAGRPSVDATNGYLYASRAPIAFGTADFTMGVTFWPRTIPTPNFPVLWDTLANSGAGGRFNSILWYINNSNSKLGWFSNGTTGTVSTTAVPTGQLCQCMLIRRGGTLYYGINGKVDATTQALSTNFTATTFNFARYSDTLGVAPMDSVFYDAFAYDRAVTAAEVAALYSEALRGYPETLNRERPRVVLFAPFPQTVSASGIASAEAFGTAAVTPGAVAVSPSGVATAEAFGTATLTPGAVTVSPSGIGSAEAFGTAVVRRRVGRTSFRSTGRGRFRSTGEAF